MSGKFVDTSTFEARNMEKDGNIDFGYWHEKTIEERLRAAMEMIAVAFNEPLFLNKKLTVLFSPQGSTNCKLWPRS
jgi:hypothetical protein